MAVLTEADLRALVQAGGCRYVGVQRRPDPRRAPLVLFTDPVTGSTLAMSVEGLSRKRIQQRLAKSRAEWKRG